MKKQELVRIYNYADAILVIKGLDKIAFMQRDEIQFADYGITAILVNKLKNKITDFSNRLTVG